MRETASSHIERRNFVLNVIEGAVYSSSSGFISAQTVLPALVVRLGGGNLAVGAIGFLVWLGMFLPQIFAARYVETHPWKKPWAVNFGWAQRIAMLCVGLTVWYFGDSQAGLALLLFFVFYALNQIILGITTPGWFEMFAKMIPTRKRGRLVGIRTSLGGVGAFGCSLLLTWYLSSYGFPLNYALAFFSAFVLQTLSVSIQSFLVEQEPSVVTERKKFFAYLVELPKILKQNVPFRNFIIATLVQIVATMPVGFYTVYALKRFSADDITVGKFTLAIVAVQVVSSLAIGFLTDKRGNKLALVIAAIALFCANLCAMFAPSLTWFVFVYIFLGINLGTELLARYNISIEYGPPEQRATYIGLMNTIVAPFYSVGMIGGAVSDTFGYSTVFAIGIAASLLGILLMIFNVREPRIFFAGIPKDRP